MLILKYTFFVLAGKKKEIEKEKQDEKLKTEDENIS